MFLSSVISVVAWTTQVVAIHGSESLCDFSKYVDISFISFQNKHLWVVKIIAFAGGCSIYHSCEGEPPTSPRPASNMWRVVGSTCGRVIYASNYRSGSGMLPHGVSCHGYWDWLLLAKNGFALPWFSSLCLLLRNWYVCRLLTFCLCPCNVWCVTVRQFMFIVFFLNKQ
jgi:hypothetical protein